MNDAEVIRKLEPYMPLQIEVQCHRGHFVANMTLSIRDGQLTIRREHSGYERRRRASEGGVLSADVHVISSSGTVLECVNRDCKYRAERNMHGLALDLAETALRARLTDTPSVHRMTD